jgi:outer membrane protein
MKKAILVLVLLLMAAPARAENGAAFKVGHVDLQRILNESNEGRRAKGDLEEMVRVRQGMIDEKVKQKERLAEEYQRQGLALSRDALQKKQDEIEALDREVKRMIADSNTDVQKAQRERERRILGEIEGIIERVGKEDGYELIIPRDIVIFSVPNLDITELIIKIYNDQSAKGAPAPAAPKSRAK